MKERVKIETVGPLLFKISRNLFFNQYEHTKVASKFFEGYQENQYSDAPDFELEMKDFDIRLKESLAQLDEKQRIVFLMNRIDEMTYSQIAENLGLSVKAIEKRMSSAIAFLKET
jgi:RNA polymerase sigma factor (sigma-70 family)